MPLLSTMEAVALSGTGVKPRCAAWVARAVEIQAGRVKEPLGGGARQPARDREPRARSDARGQALTGPPLLFLTTVHE